MNYFDAQIYRNSGVKTISILALKTGLPAYSNRVIEVFLQHDGCSNFVYK